MTSEESTLSYEQARGELVQVVQQLEAGGSTLEESLELWERGEELARICRGWLDGARARLDAVLEAEADAEPDAEAAAGADGTEGTDTADSSAAEADGAGTGQRDSGV